MAHALTAHGLLPSTEDARDARAPDRARRAGALAVDAGAGAGALFIVSMVGLAWLLARTGWGGVDPGSTDTSFVFALVGAVTPAWLAWLAIHLDRDGATPGQRVAGLRIELTRGEHPRRQRLLRLAVHPFASAGWAWLAMLLGIAGLAWPASLVALIAATVVAAGLVSAAMLLAQPEARPVHDRIAGTRLVRASRRVEAEDARRRRPLRW